MAQHFGLNMALPSQLSSPIASMSQLTAVTSNSQDSLSDPAEVSQGFWDFLYQLQISYRLCDIQLCIREVTLSGDLPISHCIPVHKLILVGSSLFFRRCLDSGELLDMYNFDGVQPHNLQLLVDYMYHQVTWETMMANDEAAEVARILEIVRHEPQDSTPGNKKSDGKNVLVIQMQDANDKPIDPQSVSHIQKVVGHSKATESTPNPTNMKKGTRVFVKNLEEELKKHNIGTRNSKKKVVVLESKNLSESLEKLVENSPLNISQTSNEAIISDSDTMTEDNAENPESQQDHVTNLELVSSISAMECNQQVTEGNITVVNGNDCAENVHVAIGAEIPQNYSAASAEREQTDIHVENTDTETVQAQERVGDSPATEVINLADMSIRMSKEGSVGIMEVVNTKSSQAIHVATSEKLSKSDKVSDEDTQCITESENLAKESLASKATDSSLTSSNADQVSQNEKKSSEDENGESESSSEPIVIKKEISEADEASSKLKEMPKPSPYSTRYRGQKRVVDSALLTSKRRKVVEDNSRDSTKLIIIQPDVKVGNSKAAPIKIVIEHAVEQQKDKTLKAPTAPTSVVTGESLSTSQLQESDSYKENIKHEDTADEGSYDHEDENTVELVFANEIKQEPVDQTDVFNEEEGVTMMAPDHQDSSINHISDSPQEKLIGPVKRRVGRPRTRDLQQKQDLFIQSTKQAIEADYPYVCLHCNKRFKNQTGLAIHEHWKHSKESTAENMREGQYEQECQTCHKTCSSYQALVQHMRSKHLTAPTHQCEDCKQYFSTLRQYKSHRIKDHGDILYSCEICGISFRSPEGHKIHMFKQHTKAENSHVCYMCGKTFKMKHELTAHLKITHAPTRDFQCQLCERAFKNKGSLKRHLETFHSDVKKYPCPECSMLFKTRTDMQAHQKKHFRSRNPLKSRTEIDEADEYKCNKCDKVFKKAYQCQAHERIVHMEKEAGIVYVCTMCNKSYSAKNYLLQHIRQMHLPKKHKCKQCLYEFTHAYMLRKHMPKCKGYPIVNKPYRCSRCHRSFNLKGNLTRHIRSTTRCRGATQDSYPDYIVVLSSDTKKGIVEGRITGTSRQNQGANQPTDKVTLEALQASEALQQLQASGVQLTDDHSDLSNIVVEHGTELLASEELVQSEENEAEEVILEQGQVILENVHFDPSGDGEHVQEDGEIIQDVNLEDTLAQMASLKDIISLPDGLRTMNIQKDQFGNMIIEVTNSQDSGNDETGATVTTESSDETLAGIVEMSGSATDQEHGIHQLIQTSDGNLVVPVTAADGTTSYQLVQGDSATEIHMEGDGNQLLEVIQENTDIQQLVQSSHQLEGSIQMIQKNGTIQLVQTTGSGVQVLEAVGEQVDIDVEQVGDLTEGKLIVKEEDGESKF